ncbi:MAG: phosphatidate cytidylyltransferase [Rhodopila sp.]
MTQSAGPTTVLNPPGPAAKPPSARWSDLRLRVLSASVLAPLALACIWFGGVAFTLLVAMISVGLAYEWLQLCERLITPPAALSFLALPAATVLTALGHPVGALVLLAAATAAASAHAGGISASKPLAFGIPYLGLGSLALVWLRLLPETGRADVIILLLVVWASDIGAYLVGRIVGGPRLAPAISPGKTWSGAAGGLLAAVAVGLIASFILGGATPLRAAGLAALTGCVSQIGDLFESHLKRRFGVKDSGWLVPGHGGLLDRLDAVLFAAPLVGLLALILGAGVVIWQ